MDSGKQRKNRPHATRKDFLTCCKVLEFPCATHMKAVSRNMDNNGLCAVVLKTLSVITDGCNIITVYERDG
jgi:hypothetical protein